MSTFNRSCNDRWFHPNITGKEAEKMLMDKGQDYSFLIRPSSTKGAYTLSFRSNGEVTHIKIQNTGDAYDLFGGETFSTLTELVLYYMENPDQLREKNGAIVMLKYPIASTDPTSERWFHGNITGQEAERLLLEKGKNSSFLLRESQSRRGDYVISVRNENRVNHIKLRFQNNKFDIGGGVQFDSVPELVQYYRQSPMVETSGTVMHMKNPLYSSLVMASSLEKRIKQLQKEDVNQKTSTGYHEGFWGEFHQLQQAEFSGTNFTRDSGSKPENKSKNRYKNILPYDCTRVILSDGSETLGTEYINANHVLWTDDDPMNGLQRKYIATQGPLVGTMQDFYRMIWQEESRIIINLARITERGKVQINVYWPTEEDNFEKVFIYEHPGEGNEKTFVCQFRLKQLRQTEDDVYVLREFLLSKEDKKGKLLEEPRKIYQFHYMIWPDYNVPDDPGSIIILLGRINNLVETLPNPGPLVVHCSAGIGRTGTLIVLDMIMNQIKTYGFDCDIDIFKTILMVRGQRSGLVQTQNQYQFVYLAIQKFMEIEKNRLNITQTSADTEYTNISIVTGAMEAARRLQATENPS